MAEVHSWGNWLIVIPARLQSTRLPNKPLADLAGRPLIVRVHDRLSPLKDKGARIIVGTDSEQVANVCQSYGIRVEQTSKDHLSGTDRVHEVACRHNRPFILNVQGDEPFVDLTDLERLCQNLAQDKAPEMATMIIRNSSKEEFLNSNCVKAVRAGDYALYFSRAPIPYDRDGAFHGFWQHIGVYAFERQTLTKFCSLASSELEAIEKLEQLRALEFGIRIRVSEAVHPSLGIDTQQDLEDARGRF